MLCGSVSRFLNWMATWEPAAAVTVWVSNEMFSASTSIASPGDSVVSTSVGVGETVVGGGGVVGVGSVPPPPQAASSTVMIRLLMVLTIRSFSL